MVNALSCRDWSHDKAIDSRTNVGNAILRDDEQVSSNSVCRVCDSVHSRHLHLSYSRPPALCVASAAVAEPHRRADLIFSADCGLPPEGSSIDRPTAA